MDDLSKLKADIKELARKLEYGEAHIDETAEDLHDLANSIPTHAAEPAPVAQSCRWCRHPHISRFDGACLRCGGKQTAANSAPTDNTALVEARGIERAADWCEANALSFVNPPGDNHVGVLYAAELRRQAALSQPAAPQPTPEVEAWSIEDKDRAEIALSLAIENQTEGEWQPNTRQAYELVGVVIAALARGSVAEKGER